jgi:hypothetical protein
MPNERAREPWGLQEMEWLKRNRHLDLKTLAHKLRRSEQAVRHMRFKIYVLSTTGNRTSSM